jgi:hypothetical protein
VGQRLGVDISALKAGIVLWLNRNSRSYSPTSACPVTSPSGPTPAWRSVTTVNRQATPTTIPAASMVRVPTKPSAIPWFCRFTIG